ncbi:Hypothetical protein LUCI_4524 [Lucifera butyrica]|uniref:Uncharacterized protein n=1 Tax=Lucifera butyrica TaxID=1351585 RepID=A0A498R2D4_9FIRM|nr:hypothetical protein [Lucifera butyrica]VBB05551.1 Hypothetical protein LUCI_0761 [Lucifera butyrica]VBB09234.1 Hypothetical protein LUCI_4524 [Lucifera butyrica]
MINSLTSSSMGELGTPLSSQSVTVKTSTTNSSLANETNSTTSTFSPAYVVSLGETNASSATYTMQSILNNASMVTNSTQAQGASNQNMVLAAAMDLPGDPTGGTPSDPTGGFPSNPTGGLPSNPTGGFLGDITGSFFPKYPNSIYKAFKDLIESGELRMIKKWGPLTIGYDIVLLALIK